MLNKIVSLLLIAVGIIHLLPVVGALGGEQLSRLYAVNVVDRNIDILLRHRAVLFGLLGALLIAAAFRPQYQPAAWLAAVISVASFLVIAKELGGYNEALARVVTADWIALGGLVLAAVVYAFNEN